jgi:hypothetical protein
MGAIDRNSRIYGNNVVNPFFTFQNEGTWSATNSGSVTYDANVAFNGNKSIKVTNSDPVNNNTTVSIANKGTVLADGGNYWFSVQLMNNSSEQVTGRVKIFRNTFEHTVMEFTLSSDDSGLWIGQEQYVTSLSKGDNIEFQIEIDTNAAIPTSYSVNVDGFGFYRNDRKLALSPKYTSPQIDYTGWHSRGDFVSTQTLTASTDNLIAFAGTESSNGGLTLLDGNAKLTPIYDGDVVTFDFTCTAVTPNDNNEYMHLKFIVNGVVYRAATHRFLDANGMDDYVSVSWILPVEADFKTYGGELYINPSVNVDINTRYIASTKTHNAR